MGHDGIFSMNMEEYDTGEQQGENRLHTTGFKTMANIQICVEAQIIFDRLFRIIPLRSYKPSSMEYKV